jgi:peptidoglycan-N-acetylglucosamine deacetylase
MKRIVLALALMGVPALAAPDVAFTFDDLPAHAPLPPGISRVQVAKETIAALKAAKMPPVYGLVNAALMAGEPQSAPVLKLWREAGNPLGNHTWSHPGLSSMTAEAFKAEIIRNEPVLAELAGKTDWHWFRYPYLDEGDTPQKRAEVRSILAGRGYKLATVTMGFGDWQYSEPYARCAAKKDKAAIARMDKMYLKAAEASITYSRGLSKTLYGRDIPYVLLLHIGAFEARALPGLIALYKSKGFKFVTLEQAEADPYYKAFTDPGQPSPPKNMEEVMAGRGMAVPPLPDIYTAELRAICR